jgi:hypothetical protein
MKNYLFVFFLISIQNVFSQNSESISNQEPTMVEEKIYEVNEVEKVPEFPGGSTKLFNYFAANFNFNKSNENVNGKILISFVIEIDGKVSNVKILRDLDGMGKDAIRVMQNCSNWIPGEIKVVKVRTRTQFPIKID